MFDMLKVNTAVIVGSVVFALIASLITYGAYQAHKANALNESPAFARQQVADSKTANRNLTEQVQLAHTLNRVNDEVVTTVVQDKAETTATHGAIASSRNTQAENIKQKYEPETGQTKSREMDDAQGQAQESNAIHISRLWQSYCAAVPADTPGCENFTFLDDSTSLHP
ncbi:MULTISPECIES: hypothetical protein [unclassified Caballeronia]|jgi:hypothetical protein|uniref:hypothetical protein n=1 Tax=unclassified Caballeronia TaxID=2646786 RepID=UPI0020283AC4|nr:MULTISPECIES: hypothetical protein [unclassified Caballeronia]